MDVDSGRVYSGKELEQLRAEAATDELREKLEELRGRLTEVPPALAGAFCERGPGMKDAAERAAAAKSARRKANRAARKARRKNRR